MTSGRAIRGYIFDAYGTLFDVHSVVEAGRAITGDPITLSMTWRQKAARVHVAARADGTLRGLLGGHRGGTAPHSAPAGSGGLSNGSPRMLEAVVASAGLGGLMIRVLSVDAVKTYKPAPVVYALGPQALGLPAADILFVSSNAWDVAGAKAFGYQVAWCNRVGAAEEELGVSPDYVVPSLDQLPT